MFLVFHDTFSESKILQQNNKETEQPGRKGTHAVTLDTVPNGLGTKIIHKPFSAKLILVSAFMAKLRCLFSAG